MAYGISHLFPEGTKEQYEATMIAMKTGRNRTLSTSTSRSPSFD